MTNKQANSNWISLLAIAISIVSLFYTYKQSSLASRQSYQHIEPVIKSYFDLPKEKNPVFVISNEGNIPVVSVAVGNRTFVYDKDIGKITSAAETGRIFSPGAVYCEKLKPTEYRKMGLLRITPPDHIIVAYEFSLKYFREKDMKSYEQTVYYFIDESDMLDHSEFIKNKHYRNIMSEIANFKMPSPKRIPGTLDQFLEANPGKNDGNNQSHTQQDKALSE